MANLVITVISIALVAVAALMAVFYGGAAFSGSTAQVRANQLISQSKQVYQADLQYMIDKGLDNFNSFRPDEPAMAGYTNGRVPLLNLDTLGLDSTIEYPELNFYPMTASVIKVGALDDYTGLLSRGQCFVNGRNKVMYRFWINDPYNGNIYSTNGDFSSLAEINHPIVQMCLKINAKAALPAGVTFAPNGIPYGSGTPLGCAANQIGYMDGAGDGYCYINSSNPDTIFLQFSN